MSFLNMISDFLVSILISCLYLSYGLNSWLSEAPKSPQKPQKALCINQSIYSILQLDMVLDIKTGITQAVFKKNLAILYQSINQPTNLSAYLPNYLFIYLSVYIGLSSPHCCFPCSQNNTFIHLWSLLSYSSGSERVGAIKCEAKARKQGKDVGPNPLSQYNAWKYPQRSALHVSRTYCRSWLDLLHVWV